MPEIIQVRECNGDFYCKPDPLNQSIGGDGRQVQWHCNQHEFEIVFDGENPFDDTLNRMIRSDGRWIREDVKEDHEGHKVYAYTVGPRNSAGQQLADPGLIIKP